ncbi:juvenile hormone esterase-like isoform X2 [Cylas formicarius]|nr:juvenile hormone esterase-like isoform X2 [Cylas formicarius]
MGIPYAEPPVGDLRFKAPKPKHPWKGIRNATEEGSACPHRREKRFNQSVPLVGDEDCLFLNVYTAELPRNSATMKLKPVLVYIHGGGYVFGNGGRAKYGPKNLMTEDIVLVTLNYRLGILGYLSFSDPTLEIPGNAGLKDQRLALRWVQDNIRRFGGDPNRVTIDGESAGGSSVHFHVISPSCRGLFHGAIIQSGSTLNSWPWGKLDGAISVVNKIGVKAKTQKEALDVLKSLSAYELVRVLEQMGITECSNDWQDISPVIEYPHEGAFLTKSPIDILNAGEQNQVPLILGYNSKEGHWMNYQQMAAKAMGTWVAPFSWECIIPWQTGIKKGTAKSKRFADTLERTYQTETPEENVVNAWSDSIYDVGIEQAIKFHLKTHLAPIYAYRISVITRLNYLKRSLNLWDKPGVFHSDELGYLFSQSITPKVSPGSPEDIYRRRIVKLWTNFVKYKNPTPDDELNVLWQPVESVDPIKQLDIGENLTFVDTPEARRFVVWNELLEESPFIIN